MNTEQESKLPELHQAELDADTLESYFRDLDQCADVFAVIPKMGPGYVSPSAVELASGFELLRSGQVRGLQVRYHYEGVEWWDTLILQGGVVRMTRIEQNFS